MTILTSFASKICSETISEICLPVAREGFFASFEIVYGYKFFNKRNQILRG